MFLMLLIIAEFNRTTGFIDAPTAFTINQNILNITFNGSIAIPGGDLESHNIDFDYLNLKYSFIPGLELALSCYTLKNYSLHAKYSFLRLENLYFTLGIDDITYTKNVSPVGDGTDLTGMWDDDFSYGRKPAELASVYLAFTSKIMNIGYLNIGLGRGRFIGYGPRSKLFHIQLPDTLGNFDFGIFFSYYYKYLDILEAGIEFDGRDFNAGLIYHLPVFPLDIGIAMVKLEHFVDSDRTWNPRFAFGISYNQKFAVRKYNNYLFKLIDEKESLATAYMTITDENGNLILSENVMGEKKLKTEFSGPVLINIKSDNFEEYNEKVVLSGPTQEKIIKLETYVIDGQIVITLYDLETGKPSSGLVKIKDKEGNVVFEEELTVSKSIFLKQGDYDVEVKPKEKMYYDWFGKTKVTRKSIANLNIGLVQKEFKLVLFNIGFDIGKATIKPEYFVNLDEMAKSIKIAIESNPSLIIEIQGHTDSQGDDAKNLKLSQERAEEVKEYLVKNHGVEPNRLIPKGYGEKKPIASNNTKEGRAKNRRVEFVILQK